MASIHRDVTPHGVRVFSLCGVVERCSRPARRSATSARRSGASRRVRIERWRGGAEGRAMKQFAIGVALVRPVAVVGRARPLPATAALSVRRPRRDRAARERRSPAHPARGARSRRVRARLDRMGLRGPRPPQPRASRIRSSRSASGATLVALVYWAVRRAPADAGRRLADVRRRTGPPTSSPGSSRPGQAVRRSGCSCTCTRIADVAARVRRHRAAVLVVYRRSLPPSARRRLPACSSRWADRDADRVCRDSESRDQGAVARHDDAALPVTRERR